MVTVEKEMTINGFKIRICKNEDGLVFYECKDNGATTVGTRMSLDDFIHKLEKGK